MAATTALKVRTPGLNPGYDWLNDSLQTCPRESRLLLSDLGLDRLAVQNERDKDALAGSALIRRKACQSVSAVNEFLDLKLHEVDSKLFV